MVSLDSHLDDYLASVGLDDIPGKIRPAALRSAAHGRLRLCLGGLRILNESELIPDLVVVIPKVMMESHVFHFGKLLAEAEAPDVLGGDIQSQVNSYEWRLTNTIGIETFYSPPRDLLKLSDRVKASDMWLLDIDVDYMSGMQKECYTPVASDLA